MKLTADDKKALIASLAAAAFPTATFFLFGPISLFIANLTELWFSVTDVLWPSMIAFILSASILTGVGMILRHKKKAFCAYISVLFGLGLALYIQGNFIPNDYGLLNGETVDWASYGRITLLDGAMWLGCLALPFLLWLFTRKQYVTVIQFAAAALLGVQLLALGVTCLTTDFSQSGVSDSYLSNEGLYEVSDEENVIIFVLDTFDQDFFETAYAEEPEMADVLDGFTYFENAVGHYCNTKGALPFILTREYYENEQPYFDYVEQAMDRSELYYQALMNAGYKINVYEASPIQLFIKGVAETPWIGNVKEGRQQVSSYGKLESALLRLAAMRFFPDAMKRFVWSYDDIFESVAAETFSWDFLDFYQGLIDQKLQITDGKKYQFIHLDGTHLPYSVLEDLSKGENATAITEAKANFKMIAEYIQQLKALGVYDQTCMIIVADHGNTEYVKTNPIMLVKGIGERGPLRISDAPVSHSNLFATILSELGIESPGEYGHSVYESNSETEEDRRYFLYGLQEQDDKTYFLPMAEYNVSPDGNDPEDYILTGRVYTQKGMTESVPYQYKIGDVIDFSDAESIYYFVDGMTYSDVAWSGGGHGRACFQMGDVSHDLVCHLELYGWVPTGEQHVIISSGETKLYDAIVTNDLVYVNFAVPKECVKDGMLVLDFAYPDAVAPAKLGISDDIRDISIGFVKLQFTEQEVTEDIAFIENGNANDYRVTGWHGQEPELCWTDKSASLLAVLPKDQQQMTIDYWTHPGAKDTAVYYNDEYIGTLPHHDDFASETLILPEEYQAKGAAQLLTFVTDGATSSKAVYGDDNPDERILGIAVSKVSFRPANVVGRTILFSENEALSYFTSGTERYLESEGLWTIGTDCKGRFYVKEPDKALSCHIELYDWMPGGKQQVKIVSRGVTLYEGTVTGEIPYIDFAVPVQCVKDGYLDLEFTLPDACSPKSLGVSEDARDLGIRFKSVLFTEKED